jgi:hypothetical protein
LRIGPVTRPGLIRVRPEVVAAVRYFGRYHTGWIRDGVLLRVGRAMTRNGSITLRSKINAAVETVARTPAISGVYVSVTP